MSADLHTLGKAMRDAQRAYDAARGFDIPLALNAMNAAEAAFDKALAETPAAPPAPADVAGLVKANKPKFDKTYCSNCGREFGPGDHGYSHCEDHKHLRGTL